MCFAIPALGMTALSTLSAGVSMASSVFGAIQQNQQTQATWDAAAVDQNNRNAALRDQQTQTNNQATDKANARTQQAMREVAAIQAATGETGVAGASADKVAGEASFNAAQDISTIESNRLAGQKQLANEGTSYTSQNQSRVNSARAPSLIGVGLQIASAGVTAAARNESNRKVGA